MAIRVNVDGKLGDENELLLSPLDQGFVFGASVYETLRTYHGRPFLLERHLARLRQSAASLDIRLDVGDPEIIGRIQQTLEAASNPESYVRLIVSAGVGELDYRRGSTRRPTIVILVKPLPQVPSRFYTEGIRVVVVDVVRNHPKSVSPRIKTSSLLNNMFSMREAYARGADEAVMLSYRGEVAEGSQTNIFLVEGKTVKTPAVDVGILAGITRELVLSLAQELRLPTEECVFPPEELYRADEVFITSSTREVVPVVRVDDEKVGTGRPGEMTLALLAAYRKRAAAC
jgi:branched-chain amino acid aminotransferase